MSDGAAGVLGRATDWEAFTCEAWRAGMLREISGLVAEPYAGGVVPPTLLASQRIEPRDLGVPDAPVHLNAGTELRWFDADVRDGAELERRTVVADVTEKSGRSGRLVFYRLVSTYRDRRSGTEVAESTSTTIRRYPGEAGSPAGGGNGGPDPLDGAVEVVTVTPSSRDVVRFAAATGDFYEMHYDADFARERGLPGTITHGLLKLSYLARAALEWAGPGAFVRELRASYRGIDLVGRPFHVFAKPVDAQPVDDVPVDEVSIDEVPIDDVPGARRVQLLGVSANGRVSTTGTALLTSDDQG